MSLDNDPYYSIGKPVANTAIKIVGPDGSILSSYQRGEICVKGPQVRIVSIWQIIFINYLYGICNTG